MPFRERHAALAQLDRVFGYEPKGRGFESLTPCQKKAHLFTDVLFSVIFACGKFYAQVRDMSFGRDMRFARWKKHKANIISLRPTGTISLLRSKNITLTKSAYH